MPKNVRNFWVISDVSGYKNDVAFGPRSRDGEMYMKIFMYPDTENPTVTISGYRSNGMLQLKIETMESESISQHGPYDSDTTVITMVS